MDNMLKKIKEMNIGVRETTLRDTKVIDTGIINNGVKETDSGRTEIEFIDSRETETELMGYTVLQVMTVK